MISAVVLAAARVQRSGEETFLHPLSGKPALQYVLESAVASALDEIICVAGNLNSIRRQVTLVDEKLFWLSNRAADRGHGTSVIAGLWATNPKSDGVMILAGDQPFIPKDLINAVIEKFYDGASMIVASGCNGEARHPLLFRRELFPELLQLTGDGDLRTLLAKHEKQTALVQWLEARKDSEQASEVN